MKTTANTKRACFMSSFSMSVVVNLPPLLFLTFHELYGISFSALGSLILVNFGLQLLIDLIFSFGARRFSIPTVLHLTPILTFIGFGIFALLPPLFPRLAYLFLVVGTLFFATASGLCEVLISPIIAALPAEDPEREMSKLHSVYAWGVAVVVPVSTLLLALFGRERWFLLPLFWSILPLVTFFFFCRAEIPVLKTKSPAAAGKLPGGLLLCIACIFFGSAAENTMAQWCSGYLEIAFRLPKLWGDLAGVTAFAVMLGIGRTLYAKHGRGIRRWLLWGFVGALLCYLVAALSQNPLFGVLACALTGLFASMLWPGTLIYAETLLPGAGVVVYALLAAGGDLGGSVVPQIVGALTDRIAAAGTSFPLFADLSPEQAGFRIGVLAAALFPLLGILTVLLMRRLESKGPAHAPAPTDTDRS